MGNVDLKRAMESIAMLRTIQTSCETFVEEPIAEDDQPAFFDGASIIMSRAIEDLDEIIDRMRAKAA